MLRIYIYIFFLERGWGLEFWWFENAIYVLRYFISVLRYSLELAVRCLSDVLHLVMRLIS